MRHRLTHINSWWAALLVAAAAVVALLVLLLGREAGWGGSGARGQSGPPLTLTLSATKQICETDRGQGYVTSEWRENDRGELESVDIYAGWAGIAEIDIGWSVSGGTAPYELEIDGETRDSAHEYQGATGTASVSCALKTGETFIDEDGDRRYRADPPPVDSGRKTIRATVTDGSGAKAEAAIDIYVVLIVKSSFVKLRGGETYRVRGFLMTMPEGVDMETGEVESWSCEGDDCESGAFQLFTVGDGFEAAVWLGRDTGKDHGRTVWLDDRPRGADDGPHRIEDKLDQLVESIGRMPQVGGDSGVHLAV